MSQKSHKRTYNKFIVAGGTTALLFLIIFLLGPRVEMGKVPERNPPPRDPKLLEGWVQNQENLDSLRAGVPISPYFHKEIVWQLEEGKPTDLAVVYLPGFGAGKGEIAPVPQRVAEALGANLYFARLTAHGMNAETYSTVRGGDWQADAREALKIGQILGRKVILMGTSTGATLAAWLCTQPSEDPQSIAAAVLLSANFGLQNPSAGITLLPWGTQIAWLITGGYRVTKPVNEAHALNWSLKMRIESVGALMNVVNDVAERDFHGVKIPAFFLWSPKDDTVDLDKLQRIGKAWGTGALVKAYPESTGHVMAGDIRSPGSTENVIRDILEFLGDLSL